MFFGAFGPTRMGSNRSAQESIGSIKGRRTQQVLVYTHHLAGTLYCPPEGRRHLQNFIRRPGLGNPCVDLNVLF